MRQNSAPIQILMTFALTLVASQALADAEQTIRSADQTLREIMAIPARQIPAALLSEAQGVAIIPDVLKIGFVAGIRRGHGVVIVRGDDGSWSTPRFVTLTGGSIGWQAGVQGTDVVLVFITKKSVEGLLNGKFTIGADAAAAAGPVGRNASAATDIRLKAEILSYSRSRGLFAGLALDGSAIEIDRVSQSAYYGTATAQQPAQVPESAMKLLQDLTQFTQGSNPVNAPNEAPMPHPAVNGAAPLRQELANSASQLYAVVDDRWRMYLALPREVFEGTNPPQLGSLQAALRQFDCVAQDSKYQSLFERAEFQATYGLLQQYVVELSEPAGPRLALPPPPTKR